MRASKDERTLYIADTGLLSITKAALIVYDIESKTSRRLLEGHPSVSPQSWTMQTPYGPYSVAYGLINFEVGVDGLSVSHDGRWLYYATMCYERVPSSCPDMADRANLMEFQASQVSCQTVERRWGR